VFALLRRVYDWFVCSIRDGQDKSYDRAATTLRTEAPDASLRTVSPEGAAAEDTHTTDSMNVQRFLPLALLHAADGEIRGKTRFQKLAFLTEMELDEWGIEPYDFVPYDYGPFSKELLEETETLETEGLLTITERRTFGGKERYDYRLTSRGVETYDDNDPEIDWHSDRQSEPSTPEERFACVDDTATSVVDRFGEMPVSNLIDHVYDEYPEYAKNSVFY
jgi:hypothetical protein